MACNDKNPLTREGTSINTRALAAISAGYALVDERQPAALVLFAKRYAAFLNYYRENNTIDGNWQPLMQADPSVALAALSGIDTGALTDYKKGIYKNIKLAAGDAEAKTAFKYLFDTLFSLCRLIAEQLNWLPAQFEYSHILRDVIVRKLQLPLANLEQCFNDFKTASLLDYTVEELDNEAPVEVRSDEHFKRADLGADWTMASPDIPITLPVLPTAKEVIVYVINHNLFNAQVELLLNGVSTIVARAADLFEQTLQQYPQHAPHYALFLSFIELFRHEQDELNRYTGRHLDFYYKEVLQLKNRVPSPDAAHLVFELQKPVLEHRLLKNTLFRGAKDNTGRPTSYSLVNELIVNKASVVAIRSQQVIPGTHNLLKAAPVANSDDGQGSGLTASDQSWFTFGDPKKVADAKTGFAIASNLFYLNEGSRTISIRVNFAASIPQLAGLPLYNLNCFNASFTGAKKWEEAAAPIVTSDPAGTQLLFTISLDPDAAAIVPYDEKVHAAKMNLQLPVISIYLDQSVTNGIPYTLLCHPLLTGVDISVEVSGVKDLVLSNDHGTIDASKPFKPFGDFPDTNAAFYIGSREIFQKNLSFIELETNWKSPAGGPPLSPTAHYLRQGAFDNHPYNAVNTASTSSVVFSGGNNAFVPAATGFAKTEKITASSLEGFLRIRLDSHEYSMARHLEQISAALSSGTSLTPNSDSPPAYAIKIPATPVPAEVVLNDFSIHYIAGTTVSFASAVTSNSHSLFHLGAFGFERLVNDLSPASPQAETVNRLTLLQDIGHAGELFTGLSGAAAGMVISLLFQVAEGSSNPLRDMETVEWFYLTAGNSWKKFTADQVIDNTNNLTQSGIVLVTLGADASNNETILDAGWHWIKLVVNNYTDAVCKLVSIRANAAKVELVQDESIQAEFRQLQPAGSISKMIVSDAAVKKIEQPFDSFGGRLRETDDRFYVRVSERLRHKQRAITIWDYEHIILEKFEHIFKVKCINHAGFYQQQGQELFCENYPGHVSVITIPNLVGNSNINPLRPYTPIGLLNNIQVYLQTVNPPCVKIHVKNPRFEEIQLDFRVTFHEHLEASFYLKLLNDELEKFLCPWAFDPATEISFGGTLQKSALLNFVEERPYVDYLTCFKMNHFISREPGNLVVLYDVEEAVASTARSVLVSYYDEDSQVKHKIVSPATCNC